MTNVIAHLIALLVWLVISWFAAGEFYKIAEDKPIRVIRNMGRGGVIVRMDGRSFALSADAAQSVKVSLL